MNNSLETQLYRATALTFEELGFILPSSDVLEDQGTAALEAAVGLDFSGPFGGRLILAVYGAILPNVVSNMLGEEEARSTRAQHDALGELANVICGNVLPGIAGPRAVFRLQPPRLIQAAVLRDRSEPVACEVSVGLDGGRATVALYVEGGLAALSPELAA